MRDLIIVGAVVAVVVSLLTRSGSSDSGVFAPRITDASRSFDLTEVFDVTREGDQITHETVFEGIDGGTATGDMPGDDILERSEQRRLLAGVDYDSSSSSSSSTDDESRGIWDNVSGGGSENVETTPPSTGGSSSSGSSSSGGSSSLFGGGEAYGGGTADDDRSMLTGVTGL